MQHGEYLHPALAQMTAGKIPARTRAFKTLHNLIMSSHDSNQHCSSTTTSIFPNSEPGTPFWFCVYVDTRQGKPTVRSHQRDTQNRAPTGSLTWKRDSYEFLHLEGRNQSFLEAKPLAELHLRRAFLSMTNLEQSTSQHSIFLALDCKPATPKHTTLIQNYPVYSI